MKYWNITVINSEEKDSIIEYQFTSKDIDGAIKQGEELGIVIKAELAIYGELITMLDERTEN